MINTILLWWTLDRQVYRYHSYLSRLWWGELCNGDPNGGSKCKVTSIKSNWQTN